MPRARGQLRIVGGRWRGRRLPIPDEPGLRPTPDRIRETLFNWLMPILPGARCLDLFAGTGALGFEAVSRGAAEAVLVERSSAVARQLRANCEILACENVLVRQADALSWLEQVGDPFDVVFLDPPYAAELWQAAVERLHAHAWLKSQSRLYLEMPTSAWFPDLPPGWELRREKRAGSIHYGLVVVA